MFLQKGESIGLIITMETFAAGYTFASYGSLENEK